MSRERHCSFKRAKNEERNPSSIGVQTKTTPHLRLLLICRHLLLQTQVMGLHLFVLENLTEREKINEAQAYLLMMKPSRARDTPTTNLLCRFTNCLPGLHRTSDKITMSFSSPWYLSKVETLTAVPLGGGQSFLKGWIEPFSRRVFVIAAFVGRDYADGGGRTAAEKEPFSQGCDCLGLGLVTGGQANDRTALEVVRYVPKKDFVRQPVLAKERGAC